MSNLTNSNNFVNPHFDLIRLWLQEHIGKFITGLLILIYLATGFIIGMALQKSYSGFGLVLSWVAGMLVAILAQAARGSLVYFGQANPYRLNGHAHLIGSSAALALTVYSSYEIYGLMSEAGVTLPGIVSAIGLIIAGFLVEVFFLKELVQMNHATIVGNESLFQQVVEHEEKLSEIKIRTGEAKIKLLQSKRARLSKALSQTHSPTPATLPDVAEQDRKSFGLEELKKLIREVVVDVVADKEKKHRIITDIPGELLDLTKTNGMPVNGNAFAGNGTTGNG